MKVLRLNDASTEIIESVDDIKQIVYDKLGEDTAEAMQELINKNSYDEMRFNSDMMAYESQLDEYNSNMCEIRDVTEKLLEYIQEAKRINRDKIFDIVNSINNVANLI